MWWWGLGGMCGGRGHAWWWGACMVGGVHGIRRDIVNERAVHILLECILYTEPSHCNMCGNLNGTGNLANGLPSHSTPYLVNLWETYSNLFE